MVSVTVQPGAAFAVTGHRVLFQAQGYSYAGGHPTYDVSPDDSRFVMIRRRLGLIFRKIDNRAQPLHQAI
jgi:hypothetical protein